MKTLATTFRLLALISLPAAAAGIAVVPPPAEDLPAGVDPVQLEAAALTALEYSGHSVRPTTEADYLLFVLVFEHPNGYSLELELIENAAPRPDDAGERAVESREERCFLRFLDTPAFTGLSDLLIGVELYTGQLLDHLPRIEDP
ncbi:MAG: hypothetical protein GF403_08555 [Candidatus Coatesbacteria bacterium]|nr:hypothetical protein [Candidatus Coatesbacteria bacterium]